MAENIKITGSENAVNIVVDGNEIHGVQAYRLEETDAGAVLTLVISISGSIEVQL